MSPPEKENTVFMLSVVVVYLTTLGSLFIGAYQFFAFPKGKREIDLGKTFGVTAVFLAIHIIVSSHLVMSGGWVFLMPVSLFFAGLAGFLKRPLLATVATLVTTLSLLSYGHTGIFFVDFLSQSLQSPPGPPPPLIPEPIPVTPEEMVEMTELLNRHPPHSPAPLESLLDLILTPLIAPIVFLLSFVPRDIGVGALYLFAITGILWGIIRNRYPHLFLKRLQP
jgi:hypothetical protein